MLALLGTLLGALPIAWVAAVGRFFGLFVGGVLRVRWSEVREALRASGTFVSPRTVYERLGARLLLLLRAWSKPSAPCVRITDETMAQFPPGPFVLAGTHTGAWELAAFALARRDRTIACMVHPPSVSSVRAFLTELRRRGGVAEIEPRGALARAAAELAAGHVVVCVADQVPRSKKHAVRGSFLGRPAWLDKTPAVLATRARVPLVVCGAFGEPGHETAVVLDVFQPCGLEGLEELTKKMHRVVDGFVRAHPEDWLWLHRRWREPKELDFRPPPLPLELSAREG